MISGHPARVRAVCALALPGVVSFDLGTAVQMFARGPGTAGEPAGFALQVCGEHPGPVTTPDGFGLHVEHGLEVLDDADLVVVPARHPPEVPPSDAVVAALQSAHQRGATIASICLGAFVLGHAGLLDGRPATTHWAWCEQLAALFPAVEVRSQPLYVDDGDIVTSAGFAAGLDMCLHLVRRELGATAAARLACWNVVAPHREGGQAQFVPSPVVVPEDDELSPVLGWALAHLHEPLAVSHLARRAGISERTLTRRFRDRVGVSPKQWLLDQRLARARELLEDTDAGLEEVATRSGLPNAAALRDHLRRRVAMTPTAYRRSHRGEGTG